MADNIGRESAAFECSPAKYPSIAFDLSVPVTSPIANAEVTTQLAARAIPDAYVYGVVGSTASVFQTIVNIIKFGDALEQADDTASTEKTVQCQLRFSPNL